MSSSIDRVHFYERQYLRAYDLEAEQLYHIEMRRRLNLALHQWGIVDVLDLRESETVPGLPKQFYISRGMAIDAYGRELVVAVDTPITEADLDYNRIQTENEFFLSIVYTRELTTPPAAGYRVCDLKDQYTRWRESFSVFITPGDPTANLPEPGVADVLSDDPGQQRWPIVLGKITTTRPAGGRLTVQGAAVAARTYAGLRAQRVVTPAASVTSDVGEAARPFAVEANLLAHRNLFVGEDIPITNASGAPIVDPTKATPPGTGVLKIKKDIFLQGEFYARIAGEWLTMKQYFQSFIPDVKVGSHEIVIDPSVPPPATATGSLVREFSIEVDTDLPAVTQSPTNPVMMMALSAVNGHTNANLTTWKTDINTNHNSDVLRIAVRFTSAAPVSGKTWNFKGEWEIGPWSSVGGAMLPVQKVTVGYVAVFRP
jgi:hypothetical protein